MSLWIEIHCDVQASGPADWYSRHLRLFCETLAGENIGALFENGGVPIAAKLKLLGNRAREQGWQKSRKHGWACRNCKTTV